MKFSFSKYPKVGILLSILLISGCDTLSSSSDQGSINSSVSEDSVSSELTSSSDSIISSEVISSSDGSSESTSEGDLPITDGTFLDEIYYSSHETDENGYNIPHSIPTINPYSDIVTEYQKEAFYADNYKRASSYEDAMYRTAQGLVSGDIRDTPEDEFYPLNHLPNRQYKPLSTYRTNDTTYEYDDFGNFKSYTINNLEGKMKKIYYGAAYVSLEDVAAYLFAFGETPANYNANKNAGAQVINEWGIYGRVNDSYYSSDVTSYKYEAMMPYTDNGGVTYYDDMYHYHEIDFGFTLTPWGYGILSDEPYNNGSKITRGTVRFVYTAINQETYERGAKYIPVNHRHVFLTFNHYNDFVEYLNYENGWGVPFGWMTAGNAYVSGMRASQYGPGYYDFIDPYPQTQHDAPNVLPLHQIKSILSMVD